jgi:hypothetical protein
LIESHEHVGAVAGGQDPVPMRTWKIDGPPEMVDGIVM